MGKGGRTGVLNAVECKAAHLEEAGRGPSRINGIGSPTRTARVREPGPAAEPQSARDA